MASFDAAARRARAGARARAGRHRAAVIASPSSAGIWLKASKADPPRAFAPHCWAPRRRGAPGMPAIVEMVHLKGLSFAAQRQVVLLREQRGMTWPQIAERVKDLRGAAPKPRLCREYYHRFSTRAGRAVSKYKNCGRRPYKATKEVKQYVVKRLRDLRAKCICSSTTLQHELAKEKGVHVSDSTVRKILSEHGYRWLPRSRKRQYSKEQKAERVAFAKRVLRLSAAKLREKLSFSMDGVVLGLPPKDPTDRLNFCKYGDGHVWRRPSEALAPELAGHDEYAKQLPLARALPMWGGCSAGGVAPVLFHETKKCSVDKWAAAVDKGLLAGAIKALGPVVKKGPWYVLCDNEHFLTSTACQRAHERAKVILWHVPAHSPDLNPIEKYWGWLRKKLRAMDLADALAKRPVLGKAAYKARVRRVMKSAKSQTVAGNYAKGLRGACKRVVAAKGAAVKG